ncbi:MAG TPA: HlyD family efflux transporter periplasmic adaptor subunit [Thermoanaerobaculia bacterium]|nr:HlyD family efflux transporter periplasmic adaptor subunit [Thermoanaerobaculia bacterium]
MDIVREGVVEKKRRQRILMWGGGVVLVALVTLGISQLKPAAPTVERATIWPDEVKRGPMLRQVRGTGSLVPEEIRWISAATDGRIESILVHPGAAVTAETLLMELTDPQEQQSLLDAEWQLRAAEAELASLRSQLESQRLEQESAAARLEAEYQQAKMRAETDRELARQGLLSNINLRMSESNAAELEKRWELEQQRLVTTARLVESRMASQRATVEQRRAQYAAQRQAVDSLAVRAGIEGVLQQVNVEIGQRVAPGTILARVVEPSKLKAELRIAETQAKDIQLGQKALIDTRNGVVEGSVSRIDPGVREGTVTVDVRIEGELPRGARPDLTVDGTIELERLASVVYVGRAVHAQERSTGTIFRMTGDGHAVRVPVEYGRSSVSTIEIVKGLEPGDEVILSDMSAWDEFDRVKLR